MREVSQILRITATTLPHQMRYTCDFLFVLAGMKRLSDRLCPCALQSLHTTPSHGPLVGHFMTSSFSGTLVGQK